MLTYDTRIDTSLPKNFSSMQSESDSILWKSESFRL